MTPPIALTIAGSDSGGGAGIQADLATMAALGVHGSSVITVVTAQNTLGVQALHPLPASAVRQQLDSVLDDLPPAGVKCGLLGTPELIDLVAKTVAAGRLPRPVVDPVLIATSGDALTVGTITDVVTAYRDRLAPHTRVLTPNPEEAATLLGGGVIETVDDRREAAAALRAFGPDAVVVTGGGAGAGAECIDVVADADGITEISGPALDTDNDHGSGCTHSSALAALLASGADVPAACRGAHAFVRDRLTDSRPWRLGAGRGPVSHVFPTVVSR